MPAIPALAVDSATGAIGRLAAEELSRLGLPLRLLARTPSRAPQLPGATVEQSAFGHPERTRETLEGVTTLLIVVTDDEPGWYEHERALLDAAVDEGVRHVVLTSVQSAGPEATFTHGRLHAAAEEELRTSGVGWTVLRPSFTLDLVALLPDAADEIHATAGDGRVAAVAKQDVARAAAAVLRDPVAHAGRTYELTGPAALSFETLAETLSAVSGRSIRYVPETAEEGRRWRAATGAPDWQLDAWISTFTAISRGEHERVTGDVEELTGRRPLSLEELLTA